MKSFQHIIKLFLIITDNVYIRSYGNPVNLRYYLPALIFGSIYMPADEKHFINNHSK
jgi:hypothetical protein